MKEEHKFSEFDGWIYLEINGEEEYRLPCPHCSPSFLTYKPEIQTHEICLNADLEICKGCHEPGCEYAGCKSIKGE